MGNIALANTTDGLPDPGELEDEADSLEALEQEDLQTANPTEEMIDDEVSSG